MQTLKVLIIYFAVAGIIFVSNLIPVGNIANAGIMPTMLSVVLLIPLWVWYKEHTRSTSLSKQIKDETRQTILFWISMLFILALIVRIPSVLLFDWPFEKTPLIYLIIFTVVILMKNDVSAFGFTISRVGRMLLLGSAYYIAVSLLPIILSNVAFYILEGQLLIGGFDSLSFLFMMPFQTFCVGISEEGLFRGYMQTRLARVYSIGKAILLQALLFGLWHFVWHIAPLNMPGMTIHIGYTFIWGLLAGYFYRNVPNLTPLVLAHGLHNSVQHGLIYDSTALGVLDRLPPSIQVALSIIPVIVSWVATAVLTKFLTKRMTRVSKSTRNSS